MKKATDHLPTPPSKPYFGNTGKCGTSSTATPPGAGGPMENLSHPDNLLAAAGIETPAMQFHQLNVEMADLNVKMGQLLDAAKREGIVIKGTE